MSLTCFACISRCRYSRSNSNRVSDWKSVASLFQEFIAPLIQWKFMKYYIYIYIIYQSSLRFVCMHNFYALLSLVRSEISATNVASEKSSTLSRHARSVARFVGTSCLDRQEVRGRRYVRYYRIRGEWKLGVLAAIKDTVGRIFWRTKDVSRGISHGRKQKTGLRRASGPCCAIRKLV